ncbi:MAG: hypothetical protein ACO3HN_07965 [Opitutales bacterium]
MSRKGTKLLYKRTVDDPILRAVLADINKSAQTPPPGFRTREQWAKHWRIGNSAHADKYIQRAIKIGKLVRRDYRVVTKTRLRLMAHFGPPSKLKAP